jgi:hypothetical protein
MALNSIKNQLNQFLEGVSKIVKVDQLIIFSACARGPGFDLW